MERGKIVSREEEEEGQSAKARKEAAAGNRSPGDNLSTSTNELSTTQDICYNDDLIVDGSLCVGFDCTCNYSFGFDTIVLKENNLRIFFDDTSTAASFPRNDWRIVINDSANGGAAYFGVEDATGGRRVFSLEAGAPSHSLYIDDGGRAGFGTSTPSVELHTVDGDTPALRLQQDGSAGFAPQTWDVAGNETNFFVRDVTNGSTLPFRIQPDAPNNVMTLRADGKVGLGTWGPSYPVHLVTDSSTNAQMVLERTSGAQATITGGNSGVNMGSQSNHEVRFVSNGVVQMTLDTGGGISMATGGGTYDDSTGQWVDGSSREYKENIAELSAENAIAAIKELKPVTFKFKNNKDANDRQVGFIAEDVPELVATKTRKGLSSMDIVAVLTKVVQEQQKLVDQQKKQMSQQQETIAELKKRVEQIEKKSK
ncbi:MAG: tail fiber domain-containing protein [bacterium]|nr:tail fiber domain-containing protein [bacterium]